MFWHGDPSFSGMRVPMDRVSCPDTEMKPGPPELAFLKNSDLHVMTWNPVHRGFARILTPCGPDFMSWHKDPSFFTISVSGCRFGREKNPQILHLLILNAPWIQPDFSHTARGFLIPPCYLEVSIGDTQEHPLGVYLEQESLYFNIT